MSVYVDPLFAAVLQGAQARRHGTRWCHMFADSIDELHAMADRIGLKRAWFQDDARLPHYDLVPSKRALAVRCGAVEVSRRDVGARVRAGVVIGGPLGHRARSGRAAAQDSPRFRPR